MIDSDLRVIALIPAKPGSEDRVREALTTQAAATQDHRGFVDYAVYESAATPGTFVTVETWHCQEDLDAHLQTDDITAALGAADGHLAGGVGIHPLVPVTS